MKNQTLFDKRKRLIGADGIMYYEENDIKESINNLKENIILKLNELGIRDSFITSNKSIGLSVAIYHMIDEINKEFGEKLLEENGN